MVKPTKSHGRLSIQPTGKPRELLTDRPHIAHAWTAKIITLFPSAFPGVLGSSLTGKALDDGLWQLNTIDLRNFGLGKHKNVDDTPTGGGAGMVLRADVMSDAIEHAMRGTPKDRADWPLIFLSPRGKPFTQDRAQKLSESKGMTLICGRFEGLDQRVIDHYDIEEISLGDFVMTGGELAAQAMIDATVRLLPGVLGNPESAEEESHSNGLLEHPQFTKPAVWNGMPVPPVLLSGNHGEIAKWRKAMSEELTKERRPDLWAARKDSKPS